jgi:hypothetical protein
MKAIRAQRMPIWASLCAAILGLSACGGGGGGSSAPAPANLSSASGAAALSAYLQASHQNTLSAKDNSGNSYSLQLNATPNPGTTTFNGTANASSRTETVNLYRNGLLVANGVSTSYYTLNPYVSLGNVSSTGSPYMIASNQSAVPTTVTVGQSGPLDNDTYYHDSTMSTVDATAVQTYSVLANSSTTLLFCINDVISNVTTQGTTDGMANSTESDCYSVDGSGNISLFSVAIAVSGVSLTFN